MHFNGFELVGSGKYWQLASGGVRRSRLELRTQVSGHTSSILRVTDGRYLWSETTLPSGVRVERVDLKAYRAAAGELVALEPLHLGGLLRLLMTLNDFYDFTAPRLAEIDRTPLYVIEGSLTDAALAKLSVAADEELTIPLRVIVAVGREGDYFPRLVEFYVAADREAARQLSRPTLTMRWSDIRFNEFIDPGRFIYAPQDDWEDVTEVLIQKATGKSGE